MKNSCLGFLIIFFAVITGGLNAQVTPLSYGHAHNDYVEIASDFGLLGLGLLGLLVTSTLWTAIKVLKSRRSPLPWGMAFGVSMSVVALAVHSMVDFNLQIPANALTMVVILAMGWISHHLPSSREHRTHSHKSKDELT